jgi:predicted GNAT superfamily acetyltransferase
MTDYTIRPFRDIEELRACVALQEETWGHGFSERVAPAILKVSQILGGIAAGAYDPHEKLTGFVFGMTGVKDGEIVHWSDMLAVRRGVRDTGLGKQLKAYQRQALLERGIETMFWTFDPLQSRNAYLNFSKLGIVAREYARDMYGQTDSPLHRGIGTDRLIALWLLTSPRVERRVSGVERGLEPADVSDDPQALGAAQTSHELVRPGDLVLDLDAPRVRVAIPADISNLMAHSTDLAVAWREATRAALTHYLDRGYEVQELVRCGRTSEYLLSREPAMRRPL